MPAIEIKFDESVVKEDAVMMLSGEIQKLVPEVLGREDFVVDSSEMHVKNAPIEIYIEMKPPKVEDIDWFMKQITELKKKLSLWKKENNYPHAITVRVEPRQWKFVMSV